MPLPACHRQTSNASERALARALMNVTTAREHVRAAMESLVRAGAAGPLPEGAADVVLDLTGCHGTLARDRDELIRFLQHGKEQAS